MSNILSSVARVVVVDDHGIVRFGYSQLIDQEPSMQVCGMASSEQEGRAVIIRERPDLAIIDLSLKEGDGLDLVASIIKTLPHLKILVVSAHDESLFAHRVLAAGARGYINKQEAPEKLIVGIQTLLRDEFYFSQAVTKNLIRGKLGRNPSPNLEGIESLTNRELQVFELIGNGQCTRDIADALYLSTKTIERHKENIKQKLHINHSTQLVQHATQWVIQRGY